MQTENAVPSTEELIQMLTLRTGMDVVAHQSAVGQLAILHAGMSQLACLAVPDACNEMADIFMRHAGLDPMDITMPIPQFVGIEDELTKAFEANSTPIMGVGGGGVRGETVTRSIKGSVEHVDEFPEAMQQIERRRLIGTVIMTYAIAKMAGKNGSRKDVADKLAMMVDTLLESFDVSMQEVLGELNDRDDPEADMDIGNKMV
jgi:hypothetical protein